MVPKIVNSKQRRLSNYDRMSYRFLPPLFEFYRSYSVVQNFRNSRDRFASKRESLKEFKIEETELTAELEKNRKLLLSETCNVEHLCEQNQNKLRRTLVKLELETDKLNGLTSNCDNVVRGKSALVNVERIMNDFLTKYSVHKRFVDDAAKQTKLFDSFSDIINKYNSLMSIFRKNKTAFNDRLNCLQTTRIQIDNEKRAMEEQLAKLLNRSIRATRDLNEQIKRTNEIERKLVNLQTAGFQNEVDTVRINLHRANLISALISKKAVGESIVRKPFEAQIDVISEKFKMLSSIAKPTS